MHAVRCREPLFIAANHNRKHGNTVDIIDLSGQIVKRVQLSKDEMVWSLPRDLVRLFKFGCQDRRLLNPATGAVHHLPNDLAEEHKARGLCRSDYHDDDLFLFGHVTSAGEYKMLRMLVAIGDGVPLHLCEVCNVGRNRENVDARWRGKQTPPVPFVFHEWNSVAIDDVIYLTSASAQTDATFFNQATKEDLIISFNLEKEEWGPNIPGPLISFPDNGADDDGSSIWMQLTLANLDGSLAVVHGPAPYLNISILKDFHKGLCLKQYRLQVEQQHDLYGVHPLLVLDDGKIVIHIGGTGLLQIYDPRTDTSTNSVDRKFGMARTML